MKRTQVRRVVVGCALACGAQAALAADETNEEAIRPAAEAVPNPSSVVQGNVFEAGGVPVAAGRSPRALRITDGIDLYAGATFLAGHDSNVNQAPGGRRAGSSFFRLRPTVTAESRYRADRYALAYKGDFAEYPDYDPNSVAQNDLIFSAQNNFTGRAALAWEASVGDHYDPVGSTDRNLAGDEADHYRTWAAGGTFRYGAEQARGRLEFDAGTGAKRYRNNRAWTEGADVDNLNLGARFFYRVAPKTRALVEYRRTRYEYVNDINHLDNTDSRALLGLSWDATAAITGALKAGQQYKDYRHEDTHPDYSGLTWEASVRWRPRTYSRFDLVTGRSASDPTGGIGVPITRNVSLAWKHDWSAAWHSSFTAQRQRTHFNGGGRKDTENVLRAGVMYDLRRWLGVGLEYTYARRASNVDDFDYVRRIATFRAEATF
ncbi:MAG: outer membrane beta-barrel protein [Candidatus Dactylopiibacterium sp.]|nr:outer membrane beta-barrel protein [Candidatus Dactylopiibacterium sp.]